MQQKKTREVCIGLEFGTLLNVHFDGVGSAKTSIIGIDRDKYLIIKPPALNGLETKLFKKNQTVISYLHEGMIYGFRCTLIGYIKTPFPLLILSYPEAAETVNLRKHKRLTCLLNGKLQSNSLAFKTIILDISPSGCRLVIPDPAGLDMALVSLGSRVKIGAELEEPEGGVSFDACVKNLQKDGNGLVLGLEFNKVTDQTDIHCMVKLKKYITSFREALEV